ncbi:biopolymer transporter ExbD [bacterium]|nr:biopolymer transporter ExbD [bacterium]
MKIEAKSKGSSKIPTASIADIVFLLLIFFMTVTVFRQYQGLRVQLPPAKATKKIERKRMITHIWINAQGEINIDDMMVPQEQVVSIMRQKMIENPATIVSLRADQSARYEIVAKLLEQLKQANALRVNFATLTEGGGRR